MVNPGFTAPITIKTEPGDGTSSMKPQPTYIALKATAPTKRQAGRPGIERFHAYGGYAPSEPAVEHKSVSKPTTNADLVYNPYYPGAPGPNILTAATATTGKGIPTYSNATVMCDNANHQHVDPTRLTCIDVNANLGYPATTDARRKIQEFLERPSLPL